MASLSTYTRASHQVIRCATTLTPTSPTARHILTKAGFDTPQAATGQQAVATYATSSNAASISVGSCPLASAVVSPSSAILPSLFAASGLCPCGQYPLNATPAGCMTQNMKADGRNRNVKHTVRHNASMTTMPSFHSIQPSGVRLQARAFSTVAAPAAAHSKQEPTTTNTSATSAPSSANTPTSVPTTPSPSPSASTATPSTPQPPPGVSLNSAFSSAHDSLLAIDDYRNGVQALNKGSLDSARSMLERTRDIMAYVPHPSMLLFVKHLLATIASKQGRFADEKTLRIEMAKDIEKTWAKQFLPGGTSPKDADLLLASQVLSSAMLASMRVNARQELIQLIESWLPRIESSLFGRPPSPSLSTRSSMTQPPPFATGAKRLRALALYTQLIQVGLMERVTRGEATQATTNTASVKSQTHFDRSLSSIGASIASRPHLQSSIEWKEFQGELLMMPIEVESIAGVAPLLPSATSTAVRTPLARAHQAVQYFESHPELQKRPLGETNVIRDWYSPLVHAYINAAEMGQQQTESNVTATTATAATPSKPDTAVDAAAVLSSPPLRSSGELLDACLAFVERSLTSDPSHPILLRTLFPIALQAIEDSEAIQAEGLLRNILGRWESNMSIHSPTPQLDPLALSAYLDALLEYIHLLTKLEWNKVSRKSEARSVLFQKLVPLIREIRSRTLTQAMLRTTRRRITVTPNVTAMDQITDEMMELPPSDDGKHVVVPQWMIERLHVGTGTHHLFQPQH